jgi:protoporphyrinogen oxidase
MKHHWSIVGGGVSGLAFGRVLQKQGLSFTVFEAKEDFGGLARTLRRESFLFDTGAHRFHDKYPEVSAELMDLLNGRMRKIHTPSQISYGKRYIDFPLSPLDLVLKLGPFKTVRAGLSLIRERLARPREAVKNFEELARRTYGSSIAEAFLLNYSQKLWGAACSELSMDIAGQRMKGLNLASFLKEGFLGKKAKTEHLDGAFYYPEQGGIETIPNALAASCGQKNLRGNSEITEIQHDGKKITALLINGSEIQEVNEVISTIPLPLLIKRLMPSPPGHVSVAADRLHYRDVILVAFFLNRDSISPNASIYFPSKDIPFTRIYEPKNRNSSMSPEGKTSIIAEIPTDHTKAYRKEELDSLLNGVRTTVMHLYDLSREEILDMLTLRLSFAYPKLEIAAAAALEIVFAFLNKFDNLHLGGRNGLFRYSHIHNHLADAKSFEDQLRQGKNGLRAF